MTARITTPAQVRGKQAFLVAAPGMSNLVLIEADNATEAAEFAAAEQLELISDASGDYKVYVVMGLLRHFATPSTYVMNEVGEII